MTVTDRTDATDEEFRDRVAAFDGAPTPPEVREARVVEEVARAIYEAADGYMAGVPWERAKNNPFREAKAMRQAAAAVAAYRAQDGGAEEYDLATDLANRGLWSCCGQPSAEHCK